MSTFVLMYFFVLFVLLYFCNLFGLSIQTFMQNFGLLAQKLSELWSFLYWGSSSAHTPDAASSCDKVTCRAWCFVPAKKCVIFLHLQNKNKRFPNLFCIFILASQFCTCREIFISITFFPSYFFCRLKL